MLLVALAALSPAHADTEERGVFTSDTFKSDMTLIKAAKNRKAGPNHTVGPVPAGVAWDGASLWSAAGGATDTVNLLRWSKSGRSIKGAHTPQLDIRAIWTQANGPEAPLFANAYDDEKVYVRKADGSFEETGVSLVGGSKDTDSPILFRPNALPEDPAAGVLVAHDGAGALLEFDAADGKFFRDVPLNSYGSEPGETEWPAYTRFAVADVGPQGRFFYLTYAGGRVHAWDSEGMRAGGAVLEGAGEDEMSCHSFSFANGRAWVLDTSSGSWLGYKLSFEDPPPAKKPSRQRASKPAQAAEVAVENTESSETGDQACPIAQV